MSENCLTSRSKASNLNTYTMIMIRIDTLTPPVLKSRLEFRIFHLKFYYGDRNRDFKSVNIETGKIPNLF